jgi:hypothetical protein
MRRQRPSQKPLQNGSSRRFAYLALGAFSLAESGEAFFILANGRDEIWFISNRHLRVRQLLPGSTEFHRRLTDYSLGKNGEQTPKRRRMAKSRAKYRS